MLKLQDRLGSSTQCEAVLYICRDVARPSVSDRQDLEFNAVNLSNDVRMRVSVVNDETSKYSIRSTLCRKTDQSLRIVG